MEVYSLECPNCGAPLGVEPGDTAVVCAHCGSDIRITSDRNAVPFFHTAASHLTEPALPPPDDPSKAPAEVEALVAQGLKLHAIKRYREINDTSLAEAKAAVEAIERGEPIPPFHPPRAPSLSARAQPSSARVEQVRRQMTQLQTARAGSGGCVNVILGILMFGLLIVGGCGQVVRTTDMHACAVDLITNEPGLRERLGTPVEVSAFPLVLGYSSETDFGGNTDRSAGYYITAKGPEDSTWLYVEVFESSSGFYGVRFNPVPNPDDILVTRSGQIGECSGSAGG